MTTGGATDPTQPVNPLESLLFAIMRDVGTLLGGLGAASAGQTALLTQRSLATERPTLLTIAETMEGLRRGAVTTDQARNVFSRSGFTDTAQAALLAMVAELPDIGSIVALRRRGSIDQGEYASRAGQLGYDPAVAEAMYSLSEYVPPAQDVVTFAVREVFTPEIAERFGQYEDFPEEALPYFERAGVSADDARKYWAAHWGLPSIQMAFEMYHRRDETGVTLDDVLKLLRAQDVMPFWRDKIVAISTAPYTRVDVRRMHKLGIITDAQVESAYKELGYSDERAHNLMLFTIAVNKQESDDALEPFRSGLRSKMISMYQSRTLPEADLREGLDDLGYSAEQVGAYIAEATFIRAADEAEDWRKAIQSNYVKGFWTREQAITKMLDLGFSNEEVIEHVTVWDVQRELRDATEEERAQKDLTKTEVISAYRDGIMDEAEARAGLQALGYDDAEETMLIALADQANAKAQRSEVEASVRALYVAGRIGEGEARSKLGAAGVTSLRVETLMGKWADEILARTPSLSVAQIQAALRKDLIDSDDAGRRLEALGYDEEDRRIIIGIAGDVI